MANYYKIPQAEYDHAKGQLRLALYGIYLPLRQYGMGVYVDEAIEHTIVACENFAMRVRGKNIPIAPEVRSRL